jgi:hypothetical protein
MLRKLGYIDDDGDDVPTVAIRGVKNFSSTRNTLDAHPRILPPTSDTSARRSRRRAAADTPARRPSAGQHEAHLNRVPGDG